MIVLRLLQIVLFEEKNRALRVHAIVTLQVWTKFWAGINWWFSPVKLMAIEAASGCLSVYAAPLSPRVLRWLNPPPIQHRNTFLFLI